MFIYLDDKSTVFPSDYKNLCPVPSVFLIIFILLHTHSKFAAFMFRELFNRLAGLILKPADMWKQLSDREEDQETFFARYFCPLLGLTALAAFTGVLCSRKEFSAEIALKSAIKATTSMIAGYFLAARLLNEVWQIAFRRPSNLRDWYCFTGYASAPMFALHMALALVPEFFFLRVGILYAAFVIWEGATPYLGVREEERLKFTVIVSTLVILAPLAIDYLLFLLMPGLRF